MQDQTRAEGDIRYKSLCYIRSLFTYLWLNLTVDEESGQGKVHRDERHAVPHETEEDDGHVRVLEDGSLVEVDPEEEDDQDVGDEAADEGGHEPGEPVHPPGETHHFHKFLDK